MTHIVDCASIYLTMLNDMVNLWRPHNRRLAKKRPYWFSGVFCFAFCLSWADVFTLRNPLIRQAPSRYSQYYDTTTTTNNKVNNI